MDETQKQKLVDLFASQHVAIIITQGEQWATATMQAFAETPQLDLIFIMGDTEKFRNLLKNPNVTVVIDARDKGDIPTFRVNRATVYGSASEIQRGAEWDVMQTLFINKDPFEKPFFDNAALKMIRVKPKRISFTGADYKNFKVEL
ncbi:MAG TPA: pyridoxamine 5'-phosphate oxidase family protein [Candidatus Binataceae bacterium]|nr:pyridoxamine 5'-phosphate oxidase family protein [Candidatus Binataceae bacterium]